MDKWPMLSGRFPEEEMVEIDRIREKYNVSYNKIIRTGTKFYVGLTVVKELLAGSEYAKKIVIRGKTLNEILENTNYQAKLDQKIIKLINVGMSEFFDFKTDFKEKTRPIRKTRKVGRPKKRRKV